MLISDLKCISSYWGEQRRSRSPPYSLTARMEPAWAPHNVESWKMWATTMCLYVCIHWVPLISRPVSRDTHLISPRSSRDGSLMITPWHVAVSWELCFSFHFNWDGRYQWIVTIWPFFFPTDLANIGNHTGRKDFRFLWGFIISLHAKLSLNILKQWNKVEKSYLSSFLWIFFRQSLRGFFLFNLDPPSFHESGDRHRFDSATLLRAFSWAPRKSEMTLGRCSFQNPRNFH